MAAPLQLLQSVHRCAEVNRLDYCFSETWDEGRQNEKDREGYGQGCRKQGCDGAKEEVISIVYLWLAEHCWQQTRLIHVRQWASDFLSLWCFMRKQKSLQIDAYIIAKSASDVVKITILHLTFANKRIRYRTSLVDGGED